MRLMCMGVMYGSSIALLLLSSSALLFLGGTPLVLEHVGSLVLLQFLSLLLLMACYGRILQTQEYHLFADSRALSCSCATLPNSCDVLSNLPFLVLGVEGLLFLRLKNIVFLLPFEVHVWTIVFSATILVAFGSAYYHWAPCDSRLVWDRLPMTIGFMSVLIAILLERTSLIRTEWSFWLLTGFLISQGMLSIWYWAYFQDLRWYLIIQFYSLLLIIQMLRLYTSKYDCQWYLVLALCCYGAAKVFEILDRKIWHWTLQTVSGHTLKHLASAIVFKLLILYLANRTAIAQ